MAVVSNNVFLFERILLTRRIMQPVFLLIFIVSIYQHASVTLYSSSRITAMMAGLAQGQRKCDAPNGIGRVTVLSLVMWQHLFFLRPKPSYYFLKDCVSEQLLHRMYDIKHTEYTENPF
jgi:hypothetical protein